MTNDPLEALRNKDRLSLREAAHTACDVPMDGALTPLANDANSARMKVGEVLRASQGHSDQVRAMLRRLVAAVDDPLDRLPATIKRAPRSERLQPGQIGYVLQRTFRSAHSVEVDPDETTVSRADLKAWCDTQQLRPSIFYPCIQRDASPPVDPPREDEAGEIAEANADKALAVMAWLLSRQAKKFKNGDKPNQAQIAKAVEPLAKEHFGDDVRGFDALHKRLARALRTFPAG